MSLNTYLERLRYIDDLIRRKATGDLEALSRKLKLSKSYTMLLIREMRELGFPIKYSRYKGSYYYSKEGRMIKNFFQEDMPENGIPLSDKEMGKITGGRCFMHFMQNTMSQWPG